MDAETGDPNIVYADGEHFAGPTPGEYAYHVTERAVDGSVRTYDQVGTVREPVRKRSAWRQAMTVRSGLIERTDVMEWRRGRIDLVSRDVPSFDEWSDGTRDVHHDVCTFDPPQTPYRLPFVVGDSWSRDGACTHRDGTRETYSLTWTVEARDRIDVQGRSFDCFIVAERNHDLLSGGVTRRWFAPELGLVVHGEVTQEGRDVTMQMVSLPPGI